VLMQGKLGIGLLDDRDLTGFADQASNLPTIDRKTIPGRFGFVARPAAGNLAPPQKSLYNPASFLMPGRLRV